ncbi:MAG: hypothetical protein ACRC5R_00715 [Mycoplasmatales bacterium]
MFVIYLIIIAALVFVQYVYNKQYITILLGVFLLLYIKFPNFENFKYSLIALTQKVFLNEDVFKFTILISLLYLISELLIILGFQKLFVFHLNKRTTKQQKNYMHTLAIISTNIDSSDILRGNENEDVYNSSSFIVSTISFLSIPFLTTVFLIFSIFGQAINSSTIVAIICANFYAIFWFLKRFIDFKYDVNIKYSYYLERLLQKDNHSENQLEVYKKGKWLSIRIVIYFVVSIILSFVINDFSYGIFSFLILIFIDLFMCAEFFVFSKKHIDEKLIYSSLFNGSKKIFYDVIIIVLGIMFVITASDYLVKFTTFNHSENIILFIFSIIIGVVITYITKKYTIGIILTLPLISVVFSSLSIQNFEMVGLVLFISSIYMAQHFSILKIDFKNKITIIDLSYQIIVVVCCNVLYAFTSDLIISLTLLVAFVLIYRKYVITKFI